MSHCRSHVGLVFVSAILFALATRPCNAQSNIDTEIKRGAEAALAFSKADDPIAALNEIEKIIPLVAQRYGDKSDVVKHYQHLKAFLLVQAGNVSSSGSNYNRAADFYTKAVALGYSQAKLRLGDLHRDGKGAPKDLDRAMQLYREALREGEVDAINYIDAFYRTERLTRLEGDQFKRWLLSEYSLVGEPRIRARIAVAYLALAGHSFENSQLISEQELLRHLASESTSASLKLKICKLLFFLQGTEKRQSELNLLVRRTLIQLAPKVQWEVLFNNFNLLDVDDPDLFQRMLTIVREAFANRGEVYRIFLEKHQFELDTNKNREKLFLAKAALASAEVDLGESNESCRRYRKTLARQLVEIGHLEEAISLWQDNLNQESGELSLSIINEMADLYLSMDKIDQEIRMRRKSVGVAKKIGDLELLLDQQIKLSRRLSTQQNSHEEVKRLIDQSIQLANKLHSEKVLVKLDALREIAAILIFSVGESDRGNQILRYVLKETQKLPSSVQRDQVWFFAAGTFSTPELKLFHLKEYWEYSRKHTPHRYQASTANQIAEQHAFIAARSESQSREEGLAACELAFDLNRHRNYSSDVSTISRSFELLGGVDRAEELLRLQVRHENEGKKLHHPERSKELLALANFYFRQKKWEQGINTFDLARRQIHRYSLEQLPKLTAERRNIFLQGNSSYRGSEFRQGLDDSISFAVVRNQDPETVERSAEWILNAKGLTESVLKQVHQGQNAKTARIKRELSSTRSKISAMVMLQAEKSEITKLKRREQQLEFELAGKRKQNSGKQTWISLELVRQSIPVDSVLLEFARFDMTDLEAFANYTPGHQDSKGANQRYCVWVIPPKNKGQVRLIDLGNARKIENEIFQLREHLASAPNRIGQIGEKLLTQEFLEVSQSLSSLVYIPLEPYFDGASQILISPDNEMWTIPWTCLVDTEGKLLVDQLNLQYLSSGRNLVDSNLYDGIQSSAVVFADPDFGLNTSTLPKIGASSPAYLKTSSYRQFQKIPFSAAESIAILPSIAAYSESKAILFSGAEASEAEFKRLRNPKLLVLSTHGYFDSTQRDLDPLLRCGLALAGCNHGKNAYLAGRDDGVLTGLEILGTDLRGTELVVLSACETGVGETRNGEGVAGLRQAFQLAGAESVLASLWQVDDAETARFVNLFFENLAKGKKKTEALRQAQLTRIKARRARHGAAHPFFWAAFTLTGQD